jgi:hypothetical protein
MSGDNIESWENHWILSSHAEAFLAFLLAFFVRFGPGALLSMVYYLLDRTPEFKPMLEQGRVMICRF